MGTTIIIASIVSAVATVVIAAYAVISYRLASRIQSEDDEFRQQVSDLYKAIVITNLMSPERGFSHTMLETGMELFNSIYKKLGKAPIFE